ncbi:extracellular solute-binding protein [Streptomyces sp. TRM66268-LWL]|uniref:Extracellular solute-binding protein n=1 Tax=Streptomyces polyasparticus TaxID=2767826 RepID=A0ABR7SX33_9ACTN|nr:extracellular solute-binding protein [Streptomyces polyasparticus]MBC9719444.1 extracellular solute-binding protein [Streptomyces polyasparticus]
MASTTSRRNFLRGSTAAALAVTAGGALASCAGSVNENKGTGGGGKGGTTTIKLMANENEFAPELIKAFETAHPDIKVEVLVYDDTRLNAMLSGGDAPDLVRGTGATITPYIAKSGMAAPLDDYFAKSKVLKADDLAPVNDVWRFDGTKQGAGPRYGMAKDYSQDNTFWYNTKVFEAAGAKLPSATEPLTYDALLELGQKLTKRSGGKIKTYGLDLFGVSIFPKLMTMVSSAGGTVFAENLESVDFSTAEARDALGYYLEFARADVGASVIAPAPEAGTAPLFKADRYGILSAGYWLGGALYADKVADHIGFAPAPQFGSTRVSPCFGATGLWIPEKSSHKDAAWTFFEWFMGGEQAKARATSGWGLPALKSLEGELPSAKPAQKQAKEVQTAELAHFSTLTFSPYAKVDALEAALQQQLTVALKDKHSTGKLADALNDKVNKLLQQGVELTK